MGEHIGDAYIQIRPRADGISKEISQALSSGTSEYGSALTGSFGSAAKIAMGAVTAATGAVIGFAKSAVEAGSEFDTSMSQVAATMGVTTDEIGELRDFAQEMGATTAFSATEAADALNYMALAGYDADTSMEMLPNVLNLAAAGNIDLAHASDMVTDAQTALGLSIDETSDMVDQMAKASSKSNTSVEQLGDAFLKIGANARNVRGGTSELSTVLGVLADNGIKGTEAGTHLRNIMLSLTPTTDKAADAWKQLGVKAYDANGELRDLPTVFTELGDAMSGLTDEERTRMLSEMFNKTDLAAINSLIGTSADRYNDLSTEIKGAWLNSDSFTEALLKEGTSLDKMGESLNKIGIDQETFEQALKLSGGSAEEFAFYIDEWADSGMSFNDVLQDIGISMDDLQNAMDNTTGAAQAMADTQLDNLNGDITLFNSALEGAKIAVSDGITPALREFVQFGTQGLSDMTLAFKKDGLSGAMEAFGETLATGINMVVEMLPQAIDAGMKLLEAVGQGILNNLPQIVNAAIQIMGKLADGLVQALPQLGQGAMQILQTLVDSLTQNSSSILDSGMKLVTTLWEGLTQGLPQITDMAVTLIGTLAEGLSNNLPEMLPVALNAVMEFSGSLRENAGKLIDAALDLIMALADGLIKSLPAIVETVPTIVTNIAGIINDNAPKLLACGIELIGKLIAGIIQTVPTLIAEFPKIVQAVFSVITAVNWLNLGGTIIKGIVNGVKSLSANLPNAMKDIGTKGLNMLKNINWKNLGSQIINFIVNGIRSLVSSIPNALKSIGSQAMGAFKSINWGSVGTGIISGIVSGITGGVSSIVNAAKNAATSALSAAKSALGINSPSKVFQDQVGKWIPAGMAEGIEGNLEVLDKAIDEMTSDSLAETVNTALPAMSSNEYTGTVAGETSNNNVVMNIYGAAGQDINALAEIIQAKINSAVSAKEAVFA